MLILQSENLNDIEVQIHEISGIKNNLKVRAIISDKIVDMNSDIQFILIPYEDEYLIYKVS